MKTFFLKGAPEITRAVHTFNRSYSKLLLQEGRKYQAEKVQQVLASFILHGKITMFKASLKTAQVLNIECEFQFNKQSTSGRLSLN